jgi:nitrate/nitrite transport system ATP-binding protein
MEKRPMISVEGLSRRFGDASQPAVFEDIWFGVDKGEFCCLIGHSGCGKTTILNVLAGLDSPSEGAVIVDNREIDGPSLDRAVIFQGHALLPWLTVMGNISSPSPRAGPPGIAPRCGTTPVASSSWWA